MATTTTSSVAPRSPKGKTVISHFDKENTSANVIPKVQVELKGSVSDLKSNFNDYKQSTIIPPPIKQTTKVPLRVQPTLVNTASLPAPPKPTTSVTAVTSVVPTASIANAPSTNTTNSSTSTSSKLSVLIH